MSAGTTPYHRTGYVPKSIRSLQRVLEYIAAKIIIEMVKREVKHVEDFLAVVQYQVSGRIRSIDWFRNKCQVFAFAAGLFSLCNVRV